MKRLKNLLLRFKHLKIPDSIVVEKFQDVLERMIKVPKHYYEVSYKKPRLIITSTIPALKNEIFINKEQIIKEIQEEVGRKIPIQILFK